MKQLHVARHAPEAHLVRGFLAANGIATMVRGEHLGSGWGELPVDVCAVWVVDDDQFERANELVIDLLKGSAAQAQRADSWECPHCRERLEGQFTDCWNCAKPRPAAKL